MTTDDCKEWSCGTCTYVNKPLFLACEMCGQDRPSQRPSPPRRQPSLNSEESVDGIADEIVVDLGESFCSHGRDLAPRSVQRHRSSVNIEVPGGTLIMTDDPADYESQDGKKHGEDDDESEQDIHFEPRSREDDPTLDDSMDQHILAPSRSHNNEAYHSRRRHSRDHDNSNYARRQNNDSGSSFEYPPAPRHSSRRSAYQAPPQFPPPTAARKLYGGSNSNQTLPTAYMSSSSSRLQLDDSANFADDVSSLSSGRSGRYSGSSSRLLSGHPQPGRPRLAAPQEVRYHGRSSNGLPVITREQQHSTRDMHHHHSSSRRSNGGQGFMGDASYSSTYSDNNSVVRSPVTSHGTQARPSMAITAASMRHIHAPPVAARASARRGSSVRDLSLQQGDFIESVLPSLAPPPVPTMDSPGDVDVMAVFHRDQQASVNRRKSADETRKDRGKMLDNLARSGALGLPNSSANQSNRSLGMGSGISLASSSRRLQPNCQKGFSSRLLGAEELEEPDTTAAAVMHPAMMQHHDEALDSPNTRKERRKERRRMKGAVRTLMATMRIASVTK